MRAPLAPRQQATLDAIKAFTAEFGYSPNHAELANRLGINTSSVAKHLNMLERKGYVTREYRRAGSLRVVEE